MGFERLGNSMTMRRRRVHFPAWPEQDEFLSGKTQVEEVPDGVPLRKLNAEEIGELLMDSTVDIEEQSGE